MALGIYTSYMYFVLGEELLVHVIIRRLVLEPACLQNIAMHGVLYSYITSVCMLVLTDYRPPPT